RSCSCPPMRPRDPRRLVSIELHDVAPATWPECETILRTLDELGAKHLPLMVVPYYHHGRPVQSDTRFVRALGKRLERGDELSLHGYYHIDDEPPPRTLRRYVQRRMLTRAAGECAASDAQSPEWR